MTVQIKTLDIEPKRQTFGHVARRLGADKPATRYQEATLDVQARRISITSRSGSRNSGPTIRARLRS